MNNLMSKTRMQLVGYKRKLGLGILRQSPYDNIYYCCTQKTASQWFKAVFTSGEFYRYTGLQVQPYRELGLRYAAFDQPFARRTIATHLYIGYPIYQTIAKPDCYKTFFVLRDPRDCVVSWYFSAKYSHAPIDPIPAMRQDLEQLDFEAGMRYIIDKLVEYGSFEAQRSWLEPAAQADAQVRVFRYEDLAQDHRAFLRSLFDYLELNLPMAEFEQLCQTHRYEKFSQGRTLGSENINSHYRKGVAGDWQNYFNDSLMNYFQQQTQDLVTVLGY